MENNQTPTEDERIAYELVYQQYCRDNDIPYVGIRKPLSFNKIPAFHIEISDKMAEYLFPNHADELAQPITDPSLLLTEVSSDPFWVENRRREAQHNAITGLYGKIKSILHHYYWDLLIMPRGVGKCPYPWEVELSEKILDSFNELEEDIEDALEKFESVAVQGSRDLWEKFGCNDAEFAQALIDDREASHRISLRLDFHTALRRLIDPDDDDLPF